MKILNVQCKKPFFLLLLFALRQPLPAAEEANATKIDTLTVGGAVLQGQVTGLRAEGISFSLLQGQGSIRIPFERIDQLSTEHYYHIFYNGRESEGRIVDISEHHWLVVEEGERRELIDVGDIERFVLSVRDDDSFTNQIHNLVPYWRGSFDAGLQLEQGSTQKRQIDLAARFEYNRLRHRIVISGNRELDTQKTPDTNWTTSTDEYMLNFEDNYYFTRQKKSFYFIIAGMERDAVRQLQHRWYPATGAGYKFTFGKTFWCNVQLGIGGVFDRFTTYGAENYWALYTGAEASYQFARGPLLHVKTMYMPSIFHARAAWLFRFSASLTVPVTEMFALKFTLRDVDDNNPFPDIGNNKITTNFAFSFTF